MRFHARKRTVAVALSAVLLVAGGGAAFAYWTNTGTGTGAATTGTNVAITVVQTSTVTAMAPGIGPQTLSGKFDNTNPGPVFVGTVTASISSVVKAGGAPAGTCDASDYSLVNPAMTVAAQVPTGSAQGAWTGATIQFNNNPLANQDGCKGATVNLAYAIS